MYMYIHICISICYEQPLKCYQFLTPDICPGVDRPQASQSQLVASAGCGAGGLGEAAADAVEGGVFHGEVLFLPGGTNAEIYGNIWDHMGNG